MQALVTAATIDAESARRIEKAAAKRARQAASRHATAHSQAPLPAAIVSDRPAAASVILPAAKLTIEHGQGICRLRQAFTRLPLKYAQKLLAIVSEDDTLEGLIAEGLYYVEKTEAKLRAKAEQERIELCKANFPDHVRRLAGVFFQHKPRAQAMFIARALEIGFGPGDAINVARNEAWAWLHPAPTKGARRNHA